MHFNCLKNEFKIQKCVYSISFRPSNANLDLIVRIHTGKPTKMENGHNGRRELFDCAEVVKGLPLDNFRIVKKLAPHGNSYFHFIGVSLLNCQFKHETCQNPNQNIVFFENIKLS